MGDIDLAATDEDCESNGGTDVREVVGVGVRVVVGSTHDELPGLDT